MAPGLTTPSEQLRVLGLVKDTVAASQSPDELELVATWVARSADVGVEAARVMLVSLTMQETYSHPWLVPFVRLRCPLDDRNLGLVPLSDQVPTYAHCPEDGDVELEPELNELVFKPSSDLVYEAKATIPKKA